MNRCRSGHFFGSRDRTRTYNLPVNRRSVLARKQPGLSAASARAACIKACQGQHGHANSRAVLCRVMPFCTWGFCGYRRSGRRLVGILWGRGTQVEGFPTPSPHWPGDCPPHSAVADWLPRGRCWPGTAACSPASGQAGATTQGARRRDQRVLPDRVTHPPNPRRSGPVTTFSSVQVCRRSGLTVTVPPGKSILETLDEQG